MSHAWPIVPLGEVLTRSSDMIAISPEREYCEITVKLWGKGVVPRGVVAGTSIAAGRRFLAKTGQLILSRIDARNGAIGVVPESLNGGVVTNDFPLFDVDPRRLHVSFLSWLTRTRGFVALCKRASEGTTNRVRLQADRFLALDLALPPLAEQRRIVARIEELAAKIAEARGLRDAIDHELAAMLRAAYRRIAEGVPTKPIGEVAPLTRRPVEVSALGNYPGVSVRSFGRGCFHNPPLAGTDITWQKPYLVRAGDILVSNIKAWEGAIAVARPEDDSRVGSHRYLTFVPVAGLATACFLWFHLLTPEGLHAVGEASPGSADRNRTLGAKAFLRIPVPVPEYKKQLWFDSIYAKVDALKALQHQTAAELDALLPAILDRAFKGEL